MRVSSSPEWSDYHKTWQIYLFHIFRGLILYFLYYLKTLGRYMIKKIYPQNSLRFRDIGPVVVTTQPPKSAQFFFADFGRLFFLRYFFVLFIEIGRFFGKIWDFFWKLGISRKGWKIFGKFAVAEFMAEFFFFGPTLAVE